MIKISKTVLSGAAPGSIWEQTEGLAPAQLREPAVQLAVDPDLTVSVIAYDDGRQELEVLHTGPPHRTEHTIDCCRFEREPAVAPARTMSVSTPAALLDAAEMIRALLWDAQHTTASLWVPKSCVTLCDLGVFAQRAVEPVTAEDTPGIPGRPGRATPRPARLSVM